MSDVSAFYDRTHFQSWHQQSENSYFWCRFDINNLTCHFLMKEYSFQIFPGCMSFVTFLLAISAFLKTKSFHFNFQHIFPSILKCERNNENIQMLGSEKSWLTYSDKPPESKLIEQVTEIKSDQALELKLPLFLLLFFSTLEWFLCCSDTALSTGAHIFTLSSSGDFRKCWISNARAPQFQHFQNIQIYGPQFP